MKKRGVAQFGRALGSGPRGRWFESSHSDQKSTVILIELRWTYFNFNKLEFEEVLNNGTSKVSGLGHSILHRGQERTVLFIPKERYGYLAIHSRRRRSGRYLNH